MAIVAIVASCKRSIEVALPDTDLVGEIRSQNNQPLPNVVVGIFESSEAYDLARNNKDFSRAIALDTSDAKGEVKFAKLDPTKRYFFYGFFEDRNVVPDQTVLWDNSNLSFNIERALTRGAVTYIRITLQPMEGFLTFWTDNSNADKLPIALKLGTQTLGDLSLAAQSQPLPFAQGTAVSVKINRGQYRYQAIGARATCAWLDTVTVIGGQNKFVYLNTCNSSTVTFAATLNIANFLPVTVLLNGTDTLGVIQNVSSVNQIQDPCTLIGPKAYLTPGQYSYKAVSTSGSQVWTGVFNVQQSNCSIISF